MINKKTFAIAFFLFFSSLNAEVVKEVVIEGNKRVADETIKVYGEIEINKDFSENDLNKVLNNLYSTNFFENIDIELKNNILKIKLKEYPVINQLVILGESKKGNIEQIKKLITLKEKKSFIKSYLAKDIEIMKKLYASLGFNFVEISAKIREIDNQSLDLVIQVDRGEKTKISSISFLGNDNIRSRRLRDVIASEEDKFWKIISRNTNLSENLISLDKRLLLNYYKSNGYYDVKISSNIAEINQAGNANLVYTIDEGNRYTMKKISTNVDPVFDKNLFLPLNKVFQKYAGDYYSPFKIKKILEELDLIIEVNNLQFVEHNVQEIVEGDSINVVLNVFEGKKDLVERINVTGNNTTNEDVIRGELLVDEGDPLTKLSIEKSIAELKARGIFKTVTYDITDGSASNLKNVNIQVEEMSTGEISAGAGVGTSGGTLAFTIKENNWLGEGKSLAFDVAFDEESLSGELIYSNPNYDFLGNSLYYSIANVSNDKPDQGYENSIISGSIGTSFEQYRDLNVDLGLSASFDDLRTQSNASSSLKKQAGNFSEISANYGFTFDKRNRAFMPTSGTIISFNQSLPLHADRSFIANSFSASTYKSFSEDFVGAGKIFFSAVNGLMDDDVRLSKRRNLSTKRLRGFERGKIGPVDGTDHIGGNYAAAINLETNLPKILPENSNADLGFFIDFGNVWGVDYDSSLGDSNKIRSSTGINLNWMSPIGPMNFVLAQDISKADTDTTESFSFNLGTTF